MRAVIPVETGMARHYAFVIRPVIRLRPIPLSVCNPSRYALVIRPV